MSFKTDTASGIGNRLTDMLSSMKAGTHIHTHAHARARTHTHTHTTHTHKKKKKKTYSCVHTHMDKGI